MLGGRRTPHINSTQMCVHKGIFELRGELISQSRFVILPLKFGAHVLDFCSRPLWGKTTVMYIGRRAVCRKRILTRFHICCRTLDTPAQTPALEKKALLKCLSTQLSYGQLDRLTYCL